MHQREGLRFHLRGGNVHRLLAHERSALVQTGGNGNISYLAHNHRVFIDEAAYGIGSAIELSGEGLVHHGHVLRSRAISIGKVAARKHRHLQCVEISRRDVDHICPILLPCLFAVAEGDTVVQGALIRQAQSDCGILHAWNLPHGGRAFAEQLSERCRVVIARIIQRCLGGHHSSWVESRRQSFKVDESTNEQA